jgi:hypothetical protein
VSTETHTGSATIDQLIINSHGLKQFPHLSAVKLSIYIVQPGVSKAQASRDQLLLLAVTETYLLETRQVPWSNHESIADVDHRSHDLSIPLWK